MIRRWLGEHSGATSIEYALIATLIAVVVVAAIASTGTGTNGLFTRVGTAFETYIP